MGPNGSGDPSDDQGPLLNMVSMTQYAIAVLFVMLRFITRGIIVKKFGLDDFFIAIAVVLGAAQTVTIVLGVEHGRGRHAVTLQEEQFNSMLMCTWINMLVYFVANWAVKMSILALYHRIGSGKQGLPLIVQSRMIWFTAGIITAFTIAIFFVQLFSCVPVDLAWNIGSSQDNESCIDSTTFMHVQGAINIFTDFVLLLYPLPLLPLMKFNRGQRTALAIIFSVGVVPVAASTVRLCEIFMSGRSITPGMPWQRVDSSWNWAWVPVWSQIEVDIGIVTACLPCLSPLLRLAWTGLSPPQSTRTQTPSMMYLPGMSSWDSDDEKEGWEDEKEAWKRDEEEGWDGRRDTKDWTSVAVVAVVDDGDRKSGGQGQGQGIGVAITKGWQSQERQSGEGKSWFYDHDNDEDADEERGVGMGTGTGTGNASVEEWHRKI